MIDETEIANASAALLTLDKNGDGKLTMDELLPPPPPWWDGPPPPRGPRPQKTVVSRKWAGIWALNFLTIPPFRSLLCRFNP